MDPTQAKMMRYMPLMFLVFLYNFSAGLALYWTVQNLLTIAQTKLTRTAPGAGGAGQSSGLDAAAQKRENSRSNGTGNLRHLALNPLSTRPPLMPAQPQATLHKILELLGFTATVEEQPHGRRHPARSEDGGLGPPHWPPGPDPGRPAIHHQPACSSSRTLPCPRHWWTWAATAPRPAKRWSRRRKEAAEKVRRWGDVVELEPLSAFDRRIIHQALKDDPGIETHSVEVEGTDKKAILLRPKH